MATHYGIKPKLVERFSGDTLNTDIWDTFGDAYGSITVSNGECEIVNSTGTNTQWLGIYSIETFGVGMKLTVRSKNTSGRHASLIGFGESIWRPYPHAGNTVGCTWYSRADVPSSTIASYCDEDGITGSSGSATQDLREYQTFSLERTSSSEVKFYRNEILEHTLSGAKFENNYSVYFSADGWSNVNRAGLDDIIVIDYVIVA